MTKVSRSRRRIASQQLRPSPYGLTSCNRNVLEDMCAQKSSGQLNKKDWEDAICSVCMEYPHNAVLLLCSSYEKGCRPYMCGTSCRYSNCLDQYKKAYTKVTPRDHAPALNPADINMMLSESSLTSEKCEVIELACPLCRGQVKGWTVVEPAREFLNAKKRNCMQDDCTFLGTYKELRKHVRAEHPSSRPREVDPMMEQRWRRLERERERDDVISTIRSTMPGAMVFGDYVIEGSHFGFDTDGGGFGFGGDRSERHSSSEAGFDSSLFNMFMYLHAFVQTGNADLRRRLRQQPERSFRRISDDEVLGNHILISPGSEDSDPDGNDSNDNNADDGSMSLVSRLRRHGRVLLGRSGRRRRRREASESQGI